MEQSIFLGPDVLALEAEELRRLLKDVTSSETEATRLLLDLERARGGERPVSYCMLFPDAPEPGWRVRVAYDDTELKVYG